MRQAPTEIYTLDDLGMAAKAIAGWFDDGCEPTEISCTYGYKVPERKIPPFVKNIDFGSKFSFPSPSTKRHGWVGSVCDFIHHCELNTLATKGSEDQKHGRTTLDHVLLQLLGDGIAKIGCF